MSDLQEKLSQMNRQEDLTYTMDPADMQQNKVMGILAYLGILILIPMLSAKNSRYARFHVSQGLLLICISLVFSLLNSLLGGIQIVGTVVSILTTVASIFTFVMMIIGIVNAANLRAKELPLIGGLRWYKF